MSNTLPKIHPEATLRKILRLIHKDVNAIQSVASGVEPRWKQLTMDASNKLTKYAAVLSDMVETQNKNKNSAKKEYQKMSTDELVKLIQADEKKDK